MTDVRHIEITVIPFKPGTEIPNPAEAFIINPYASASFQPQVFIKFQVEKQVASEPNVATLEIYNLSESHSNALDFKYDANSIYFGPEITIKGGYLSEGEPNQMFKGFVVHALTTFEAPHYITRIKVQNILGKLLRRHITYQVAKNDLKADAIIAIIKSVGGEIADGQEAILREAMGGARYEEPMIETGPLSTFLSILVKGLPRRIVAYWDDAGVSFNPTGKATAGRPLKIISEASGLIGVPKSSSRGIEYETNLDPTYRINDEVQVISFATGRLGLAAINSIKTIPGETPGIKNPASGIVFSGRTVVSKMIHSGDNRGGDFKTSVETKFTDIIQEQVG